MANLALLKAEIALDPLGRGYSGMSDLQIAESLMDVIDQTRDKVSMSASEVFNAIDKAQWDGLTDAQRLKIMDILHMGTVNPFGLEQSIFVGVFGGGSATILALAVARVENVSQAVKLGLGNVREGSVAQAKV